MWVLIVLLWQANVKPTATITIMPTKTACARALTGFDNLETMLNEGAPSWTQDKWSANCELRVGKPWLRT